MSLLRVFIRLPGAPIRLGIFKEEFQIRSGGGGIVFDQDDHLASRTLDQAPKVVVALGCITGQNAPFTQHLG